MKHNKQDMHELLLSYQSPEVTVLSIAAEQGFAASGDPSDFPGFNEDNNWDWV